MRTLAITIPMDSIRQFCDKHHIRRLALFGSVLREDFSPDSDIDVLAEFEPEARVGFMRFAGMEHELADLLGHRVDLNTVESLSKYFRDEVLTEAESIYDTAQ